MKTLRQEGGLSGFTKRSESNYDPFGAAHSSTSISAGLGFTVARDMGMPTGDAIAVIGDGSISAGMAYEALNNAGAENRRFFVILNDNEMSIAPPVGAMSKYLSSLYANQQFYSLKELAENFANSLPGPLKEGARRAKGLITGLAGGTGNTFFEDLGFSYVGPIDGHDLDQLLPVLRTVKTRSEGPVVIHCVTKKGAGYAPAETASDKYHGVSKFDVVSGKQHKSKSNAPSYTSVFGNTLVKEASLSEKIVAVTAAMPSGTGLNIFQNSFPGRTFDVGIAEQHAVTFAAGMAAGGLRPFCAIYSTFLQRGYDQIVHDVALQKLPVRFAIDRAGLVGADGATHAGSFDIAFLSNLPNFITMAASDDLELARMVHTCADINYAPSAFRYPRGSGLGLKINYPVKKLVIGKGKIVHEGNDIAIISYGARLQEVKLAAKKLENYKISTTIADARFCKPLDKKLILELCKNHKLLITIEEGSIGGFGSHVSNFLINEQNTLLQNTLIDCICLPDKFIDQDTPFNMYSIANMNSENIVTRILKKLNIKKSLTKV